MKYLKYILKNIEPLRIADDSISQSGQAVTLRYIPGTTMKGYVINSLVNNNPEIFEETVYDYDTLKQRLRETAFLTKGLRIVLKDTREGVIWQVQ